MIDLPPPLEFSYGTVERALAAAYGISDEKRPAGFRSMVSNLQKHGALGPQSRVGRGATLTYTPTEMHRLVLALEFCELGIPPSTAVALLETYWETDLKPITVAAARGMVHEEPGDSDVVLYLGGVSLRTASLRGEKVPVVPSIGKCRLGGAEALAAMTQTPNDRALVVNLSARLRAFHTALAEAYMDELRAERRATLVGDEPPPKARKLK